MVSVVIPIYNVSQYIERGMSYILAQDCTSFEVILVDDGSTDGCDRICDEWKSRDSRVRVFHKENAGAGSARNLGIETAKGEYIYFFDIDDKIPSNLLSTLVYQMGETQTEMIVFGYNSIDVKYKTTTSVSFTKQLLETNLALRNVFVDEFVLKVNGFPWNKMYRKSFLDKYNLRFDNQRIQQDEVFNLKCYRNISRLLLLDCVLYDYYVYDKGDTRSRFIPERYEVYKSVYSHFCDLIVFWNLKDDRFVAYLHNRLFANLNDLLRHNLMHTNCKWDFVEKEYELNRVMNDRDFLESITYKEENGIGLEDRLFLIAYRLKSIKMIKLLNFVFANLRNIKYYLSF